MKQLLFVLVALLVAVPAAAQRPNADPDQKVAGSGTLPDGWMARVDRDAPLDQVSFRTMGTGYHATMGPAAVFYDARAARSGNYQVAARFVQTKSPAHPEAYGLVLGATDMSGAGQKYSYFLVRKDGQYFIATRDGADRKVLVNWTPNAAIQKEDANGRQTNVLGARVEGDQVIFTVNDTEVARRPKSEIMTDGYWGYRVNHNLDVHIEPVAK